MTEFKNIFLNQEVTDNTLIWRNLSKCIFNRDCNDIASLETSARPLIELAKQMQAQNILLFQELNQFNFYQDYIRVARVLMLRLYMQNNEGLMRMSSYLQVHQEALSLQKKLLQSAKRIPEYKVLSSILTLLVPRPEAISEYLSAIKVLHAYIIESSVAHYGNQLPPTLMNHLLSFCIVLPTVLMKARDCALSSSLEADNSTREKMKNDIQDSIGYLTEVVLPFVSILLSSFSRASK